ncbi:MAG: peptidoglycan DD-metalloendopeptidase family protein [bacterium]
MVDPFLDPMDTAPVRKGRPIRTRNFHGPSVRDHTFQRILQKKVEQQPTPIITPEALMPPVIRPGTLIHSEESQADQSMTRPAQPGLGRYSQNTPSPDSIPPDLLLLPENHQHATVSAPESAAPETLSPPIQQEPSAQSVPEVQEFSHDSESGNPPETLSINPLQDPIINRIEYLEPAEPMIRNVMESDPSEPILSFEEEETETAYQVKRGDTLSTIVASAMREQGMDYTTADIYRMVKQVARENGIRNPDRIYAGQEIDLSLIYRDIATRISSNAVLKSEPVKGQAPAQGRITSEFGMRTHPMFTDRRFHNGVDIAMPEGTQIQAFKSGTVTFAGEKGGYGKMIELSHDDGTTTRYGHLSEHLVAVGDTVSSQHVIGLSGNTGRSTGPHLHFEIREHGKPVDPFLVLSPESFEPDRFLNRPQLAQK